MRFNGKLANFGHFRPTFATFLQKMTNYGLVWQTKGLQKFPMEPNDLSWHYLGGLSGFYGVDLGTFLTQEANFEAVMDGELNFFMENATHKSLILACLIKLPLLAPLGFRV